MPSQRSIAEAAVGLLIVIVLRSLAELLFRIEGCIARGPITDGRAYVVGAIVAAAAALVAFALLVRNREQLTIAIALCTIVGLLIYKLIAVV